MGFTDVFGGTNIYPADVSLLQLALTEDIQFEWPLESAAPEFPLARIVVVDAAVGPLPGFFMSLPDATEAAPGQVVLFDIAPTSYVCALKDFSGATIGNFQPGQQWQVYLVDNSTPAGLWHIFQFGASTSTAQASALAGFGLTVTGATLSQSIPVNTFTATPRTLTGNDRAAAFVWTGSGAGQLNLPPVAGVGNNWFTSARNAGGGDLLIEPSGFEIIDGAANLRLSPGEGVLIITDGLEWFTLGLGQPAFFAFDYTVIDLTGSGPVYTLTGSELNRVSYKFTGVLTTNVNIVVPSTVQQYWVNNATTGSFTLSMSTLGGAPIVIPQGTRGIFYCDGVDIIDADTASIAIPLTVPQGGTGIASYAPGDMLYASAPTTLAKLAIVPAGNALISTGLLPAWGQIDLATTVTGTLPAPNGGTGQSVYAIGDILFASATNALSRLADVATGNALLSGGVGVAPSWGKINLTTHVTGVLPPANGGTGIGATLTAGSVVFAGAAGVLAQDNANFFWDDTNNWLGLGGVPTRRLTVFGVGDTIRQETGAAAGGGDVRLAWGDLSGTKGWVGYGLASDVLQLINARNADLQIGTNASVKMTILSTGQVGIGTGAPSNALHVEGAASTNPAIVVKDAGGALAFIQALGGVDTRLGNNAGIPFYILINNTVRAVFTGDGLTFGPAADGGMNLGFTGNRWAVVYAINGTIQTSDAREKTPLAPLTPAELAAAKAIAMVIGTYRWLDTEVADDSLHVGVTAQAVIAAMEEQGLDALAYGFVRYEEWEADPGSPAVEETPPVTDKETGEVLRAGIGAAAAVPGREAGNRYSVSYTELSMFIAAAQEQRLAALEALL